MKIFENFDKIERLLFMNREQFAFDIANILNEKYIKREGEQDNEELNS